MSLFTSLLYIYNDMSVYFVEALRIKTGVNYFPLFGPSLTLSPVDFLNTASLLFLFKYLDPILAANILAVFYLGLLFFFSYKLFSAVRISTPLVYIFSLTNTFSIYMVYRIASFTPNLYQVFFYPLILLLLLRKTSPLKLGIVICLFLSLSLYNAYFSWWLVIFWWVTELIISKISVKERLSIFLRNIALFALPQIIVGFLAFGGLAIKSLPILQRFDNESGQNTQAVLPGSYRPLENFYNLTFRPWYFVIPPKNSFLFSDFSKYIYKSIEDTNYYLANDYTEDEAGGSFLGWHFILGITVILFFLVRGFPGRFKTLFEHKDLVLRLLLCTGLILLISGPPSFTINGITIYTPSYLLYYAFPIFRTLVRFSAIIFMIVLLLNAMLINDLLGMLKSRKLVFIGLVLLILFNISFFALRLPVINTEQPPEIIKLVKSLPESSMIAVYPKADYKFMFWTYYTKLPLANPTGYINRQTGFDSDKFTKNILTSEGLILADKLGVTHLVVDAKYIHFLSPEFVPVTTVENYSVYSIKEMLH